MESVLRYLLTSPVITQFLLGDAGIWAWPTCETFHFIGVCLLVGIVGIFDLRVLGMAKGLPLASLKRLLPWGVFGFVLAAITGLVFVEGVGANLFGDNAYDVLMRDVYLQLKLIFIGLAGINLLAFYLTGTSRAVDALGPGDDAPGLAKAIAGTSLFLWIGVVIFGRLIPRGL
ncbi:MAG: hypothetical protein HYX77_08025 [Acidobacteria bacterium]|nr:hypothetical protein [Acidobacteriota bacterium]